MKVLITLENVVMDGVKRAATVLGNELNKRKQMDVVYYSLGETKPYYTLEAPLIVAKRPISSEVLNYFGNDPYEHYADQISDLCAYIIENDYDCVILPAGLLTSFAPFIKEKAPNVNVIAWMHNNYDIYTTKYYSAMLTEFEKGLEAADTVVVLTEFDHEKYRQFNKHTVKIYNPLTLLPEKRADLNSHIIAFTGRIAIQHKGVDLLLEAARSLKEDWKIAIAGSGAAEDMARFRSLISKYGVEDKIIYRGALKDEALQSHYESASIFVSTSRWEGMPLVMGEAMGFGLPIIAMANTGAAEFLHENRYGIMTKPQDVADFVRVLDKLTRSRFLRRYYSARSLERVKHFAPEMVVARWLPVIVGNKKRVSINI
ncbi:glycosyltransferase [Liquorilactobacillus oeni]|uniref:Glycosyl transferase, group 1 n=1 Tax=Liquorilactobacillus oeni DSM 19972 TaxID=1423777 RepID=A0A0R1MBB5_9LACO|nr:glycosyltransferase [Liquorilactobacillus oeni]KRL05527.1 glycosyl transferase, group 1 [Liquorilactobacillus oeni DSM 19972]